MKTPFRTYAQKFMSTTTSAITTMSRMKTKIDEKEDKNVYKNDESIKGTKKSLEQGKLY